ncbi:MAG TPA: alginate lyase family protein, partial [Puia sp.]|nr:alginate lyase family protein [Puia sp.]
MDPITFLLLAATLKKPVMAEADWAMKQEPVTVTASHCPRSAGGLHDFYSEADYWWPNPVSADSPYIQKDGQTNPANFTSHRLAMIRLSRIVGALASAYKLTGDKKYVLQALAHVRAWFVDTATMMNPDLRFAQAIKGRATGRGIGIIDTIQLMEVVEGLEAMEGANVMDVRLLEGVRGWFSKYLLWLTTHPFGKDEMNAANNHGTCWVMQVAAFARFTGNEELMEFCSRRYKTVLLPGQMAVDGSFPLELKRTKPYGYSLFNLDAMATICQLLSTPHNDLWRYQTSDGKGIELGIKWMYKYIADKGKWPFPHDVMHWEEWPVAQPALAFGAAAFDQRDWFETWKRLDHSPAGEEVIRNLPVRHPLIWFDDANGPRGQHDVSVTARRDPAPVNVDKVMTGAAAQTKVLLDSLKMRGAAGGAFSPRTIENGQLKTVASRDWTSGFFPGELWMLYGFTKNEEWRK